MDMFKFVTWQEDVLVAVDVERYWTWELCNEERESDCASAVTRWMLNFEFIIAYIVLFGYQYTTIVSIIQYVPVYRINSNY